MAQEVPSDSRVFTPAKLHLLGPSTGARLSPMVRSVDQHAKVVRSVPLTNAYATRGTPSVRKTVPDFRPLHQRFLDVLFQPSQSYEEARIPKVKKLFSVEDIHQLILQAQDLMADEPTLLYVSAPCRVVSDLHGQFADLSRLWGWTGAPDGSIPWVFMGDYVDRTAFGAEVLLLLYALKIQWPDKIILLRGNHEIANINRYYGFRDELVRKWGFRQGEALFNAFNNSFDHLPLAAIAVPPGYEGEPEPCEGEPAFVPSRYLMVHGGIGRLETLSQISGVQRPIRMGTGDLGELVMHELVWSDPAPSDDHNGLLPNKRDNYSGGIVCYGADRVHEFCQRNSITAILRGHECIKEGLELAFGGRVITFFSAVNYGGHQSNAGCILHLALDRDDEGRPSIEVQPMRLEPKPPRWLSYISDDADDGVDDGDLTDLEPDQDLPESRKSPDQGPAKRQILFSATPPAGDPQLATEEPSGRGPSEPTPTCWGDVLAEAANTALAIGPPPPQAGPSSIRSEAVIDDADSSGVIDDPMASTHESGFPEAVSTGEAELAQQIESASAAAAQAQDPATGRRIFIQAMITSPAFQSLVAQTMGGILFGDEAEGLDNDRVAVSAETESVGACLDSASSLSTAAGPVQGAAGTTAMVCCDAVAAVGEVLQDVAPDNSHGRQDVLQTRLREGDGADIEPSSPSARPEVKVVVAFPWATLSDHRWPTPPRPSRDAGHFCD